MESQGLKPVSLVPAGHDNAIDVHRMVGLPSADSVPTMTITDYWHILVKRKWLIITSTVVALTASIIITARTTPIYEAIARISIGGTNPVQLFGLKDINGQSSEDYDYIVSLETQAKILQSEPLALQTARDLHLDQQLGITKRGAANAAPVADLQADAQMISAIKRSLRVAQVPNTRLLEIHFLSPDPKFAADATNALINTYKEQNIKAQYDSAMQAANWLARQLADLQIRVESSQEKLVQYQREHEILGPDEKNNIITAKLDDLNKELSVAESDRIQKQAMYEWSARELPETPVSGKEGVDALSKFRADETDLKMQIAQASVQFGPNHPKVIELNNRLQELTKAIGTEKQRMIVRLRNDYLAAQQRERMLRDAFEKQKQEANKLNQSAIEYNALKHEAESNRQLYDGLLQKLKEAGLAAGLSSTNVRIVDPARVPQSPVIPNGPRNLEYGLLFGLVCGVLAAFGVEAMDNTVRTAEIAEMATGLPCLGMVPHTATSTLSAPHNKKTLGWLTASSTPVNVNAKNVSPQLATVVRPRSQSSEAYRSLRTAILLSCAGEAPKVLLVTSPLPQEGKTTTAVNLAVVLAQQGHRVLLVDADLRRPAIHRSFGLKSTPGLSEALAGREKADSIVHTCDSISNLSIVPAGSTPPHPAELLSSVVFNNLLQSWRNEYDHVVIDTPPILSVTDAVLLSVVADRVMIVIRAGKTTRTALRRSRAVLGQVQANVLGVVINAVDLNSPDYYYYYYSGSKGYGSYYHEE
jgi:succinoglycan biosynthesis transport protein ExoP